MSLIEEFGGYDCAKSEYDDTMYKDGELYTIKATGTRFFKHNLAEELLEYRRQHNIYEMDDYVIHDGELMVFAMWSEAVKDCAYVGYAYAEDGFLLHKDEFRHATDLEIKAGHRLDLEVLHDHDISPNTIVLER